MNLQFVLFGMAVLCFFLFIKNVVILLFRAENVKQQDKRFKELNFTGNRIGQSKDEETKAFLNRVTNPIIQYVPDKLMYKNLDRIQKELEYIGWNKLLNAEQYKTVNFLLKIVGIIVAPVLWLNVHPLFGVVSGILLFFGISFFMSNSVKNKRDRLFSDFPEFIRLCQGFLVAEMPLQKAIESTIEYMNEEWKPYLTEFVANSALHSSDKALEILQEQIDIAEVTELLSLIRVSIDQGIDVAASFENQAEKVRTLQLDVMIKKIEQRKIMAIILQGPLLLTILVSFGLPTLHQMMNIG